MAVRIHVVATRGTNKDAMAQTFSSLGTPEIQEAGGWTWFTASVWGVRGSDLDKCLQELPGPSMFFTTEDGSRWYVRLYRHGLDRFVTLHEFYLGEEAGEGLPDNDWEDLEYDDDDSEDSMIITIGELPPMPKTDDPGLDIDDDYFAPYADPDDWDEDEDDEEEYEDASPLDQIVGDFDELGVPLPQEFVDQFRAIPDAEVISTVYRRHAEFICDALDRFEIPHDRAGTLAILRGESVTEGEYNSDIGNLPRLLAHLGLGEYFENLVQQMAVEYDDEEVLDENDEDSGDHRSIVRRAEQSAMTEILGGPVAIPLADAPLLYRTTAYLDWHAGAVFIGDCSTEVDAEGWPSPSYVRVTQEGQRVRFDFDDSRPLLRPKASAKIRELFAHLPDGTALELMAAGDETAPQRFAGTIQDRHWLVERSHPQVTAETLESALGLFRMIASGDAIEARDKAEVDAVIEQANMDIHLKDQLPTVRETVIDVPQSERETVGSFIFRHRHHDTWDATSALDEARRIYEDWKEFEDQNKADEAVYTTGRVVLEGRASRFLEPNYDAETIDEYLQESLKQLDAIDEQFKAAGFEPMGDLVCERAGNGILRTYSNVSKNAYGVRFVVPFAGGWNDIVTTFTDGSLLTTSNGPAEGSLPQIRSLRHQTQTDVPAKMLEEHRAGIEKLTAFGLEESKIDPSVEGIAKAMDDFLVRRMGAN